MKFQTDTCIDSRINELNASFESTTSRTFKNNVEKLTFSFFKKRFGLPLDSKKTKTPQNLTNPAF